MQVTSLIPTLIRRVIGVNHYLGYGGNRLVFLLKKFIFSPSLQGCADVILSSFHLLIVVCEGLRNKGAFSIRQCSSVKSKIKYSLNPPSCCNFHRLESYHKEHACAELCPLAFFKLNRILA